MIPSSMTPLSDGEEEGSSGGTRAGRPWRPFGQWRPRPAADPFSFPTEDDSGPAAAPAPALASKATPSRPRPAPPAVVTAATPSPARSAAASSPQPTTKPTPTTPPAPTSASSPAVVAGQYVWARWLDRQYYRAVVQEASGSRAGPCGARTLRQRRSAPLSVLRVRGAGATGRRIACASGVPGR